MSDFLFNEFPQVSAKEWKQKIQFDLKGADYNETLVWESNEGIKVRPYYHQDDAEWLQIPESPKEVAICQSIFISDTKKANFIAKNALQRGAVSIEFLANEPFNISELLHGITLKPNEGSLHFKLNFLSESFFIDLIEQTKNYPTYLNLDPLGNLAQSGNWFLDQQRDYDIVTTLLGKASQNRHILSVDGELYQNAGANGVQQIAYALAHANEYLTYILGNSNTQLKTLQLQFNFAVGTNYFFEIAKLRAFRYLWKLLCDEYNIHTKPHVFVRPSKRNKTLYDYNVNMLRTTTECMSAMLGGASTISNISYDTLYSKKNEFGERIARNQLLILKEESYFTETATIAEGSYYIETITKQLAEKGLALFKDIEKSGGFLKQLLSGTIQRKIQESAHKEQAQFDSKEVVLLGTNKHPNEDDKMKDDLELYPFVKTNPRKTLIQPIIATRLAEAKEKERLENE